MITQRERNKSIEMYRFLFSIVIAFYHYRSMIGGSFFSAGYVVVEFFFILSGFLIAATLSKRINITQEYDVGASSLSFIVGKIKNLYPHYLFSVIVYYFVSVAFLNNYTFKTVLRYGLSEVLLLKMTGIFNTDFNGNGADWYVSALMIASFLLGYLLLRYKNSFLYFIAPSLSIGLYTYLYNNYGHLGTIFSFRLNTFSGTLRAIAGMSLGCICYCIYNYINVHYNVMTKRSEVQATILEICCLIIIFGRFFITAKTSIDFMLLPVFSYLIIATFLKAGFISKLFDNNISLRLGGLSYAIFLNHSIIRDIFKVIDLPKYPKMLFYILVVIGMSIATNWLVKNITKKLSPDWLSSIFGIKKVTSN